MQDPSKITEPSLTNKTIKSRIRKQFMTRLVDKHPQFGPILYSKQGPNPKARKFTDVFFITSKGPRYSQSFVGSLINYFVGMTGEDCHCELIFASRPSHKNSKIHKDDYYVTCRISTDLGKVTFQEFKEFGPNWEYYPLKPMHPDEILCMLLWCVSQCDKPFDNYYLLCQFSSRAALKRIQTMVDPADNTSLTGYICTTLTALALAQQFPAEVGCLFFHPLQCYQASQENEGSGAITSISQLTPTGLKEYLLEIGLFDPDPERSIQLTKNQIHY